MTHILTKSASAIIALAMIASMAPTGVFAQMTPAEVTAENFNTEDNSGYKGINVGFNVSGVTAFTDVTVSLKDASGNTLVTNEGIIAKLNELLGTDPVVLSTPFITQDLGYAATEQYWTFGDWSSYEKPATAVITVNGVTAENPTLSEQQPWEALIPQVNAENFNTVDDAGYKGINVGFDVANISHFEEVKVELQDASGNTIAVNEGNVAKLNDLLDGGTTVFSTPFITENLTYGPEEYWQLGDWQSYETPAKALITVNGVTAENPTLSEQQPWDSLIPKVTAENFNTEDNSGYKGINVGFNVTNINHFDEVTVSLENSSGDTLVTNNGVIEKLNELLDTGSVQFGTPFITQDLGYAATEQYWTFGDWSSYEKPATAVITVNGITVENSTLTEPNGWLFEGLVPEQPVEESHHHHHHHSSSNDSDDEETDSNSDSTDTETTVTDSSGTGTTMTGTTNGQVLGAATFTFTRDLYFGIVGEDVKELQTELIAAGFSIPDGPTTYFGPQTRAAVSAWQSANGVMPTAGYFGPISRAKYLANGGFSLAAVSPLVDMPGMTIPVGATTTATDTSAI